MRKENEKLKLKLKEQEDLLKKQREKEKGKKQEESGDDGDDEDEDDDDPEGGGGGTMTGLSTTAQGALLLDLSKKMEKLTKIVSQSQSNIDKVNRVFLNSQFAWKSSCLNRTYCIFQPKKKKDSTPIGRGDTECPECDAVFTKYSSLKKHFNRRHRGEHTGPTYVTFVQLKCHSCNNRTVTFVQIVLHSCIPVVGV